VVSCVGVSEQTERILWPLLAAGLVAWIVAFPLTNTDIWWHLASGRYILQAGLPATDPFSVSTRGAPWVDIHWLFQLAAYALWSLGGVLALVVAKLVVCGSGAALLVAATPRAARGPAVLVLGVSVFAVHHLVMVRPIVVTLLLLASFFFALERYRVRHSFCVLMALPLLQIVWVNVQGLHTLGPVLVASYLGGAALQRLLGGVWPVDWRPLAVALAACGAASFVSPYGAGAALLPWKLLARIDPSVANIYALNVSEFVSPWQLERLAPGHAVHLSLFLLLLALALLLARRRVIWSHVVLLVALSALALLANRNILLLFWLGSPILAVTAVRGSGSAHVPRWLVPGAVAGLAVAVAATREGRLNEPAPFRVPEQAAARLGERGGGNVFCSVRYGGYLIWRLHPRWSPYIDGRLVLGTSEQFAEYLAVLDDPRRFAEFRQKYDLRAVLLPTALPDRYLALVGRLIQHPDWQLIYTDGTEVVLVYRDSQPGLTLGEDADMSRVRALIAQKYPPGLQRRVAHHHLARLLLEIGQPTHARRVLEGQNDSRSQTLVARSHYLEGDLDLASLSAEQRLAEDQSDTNNLNLLAAIALERGQYEEALAHLRRILQIDPHNAQARELLGRLEEAQ
jgi:hypothetical protein